MSDTQGMQMEDVKDEAVTDGPDATDEPDELDELDELDDVAELDDVDFVFEEVESKIAPLALATV
ncbi:ammosamide/lymphostin RiPP family protein [Streptomyces sp. NPDC004031]